MNFFRELVTFVRAVANDERIPDRDKKVLLALLALLLSPFDIIPDWLPFIGVIDDVVILAVVLDYFFNVLEDKILLSHYPWGMKSFTVIKRGARFIALMTPEFIKSKIWKYQPPPF